MGAAALILGLALSAATAGQHLRAGVEQYEAGNNQAALGFLLAALDAKGSRAERGRARLFIGLIQHEAGSVKDADASFELALRLAPRLRLPARASKAATALFVQVRERLGIKTRVRKTRRRTTAPPPPPPKANPNLLQPLDSQQRAALADQTPDSRPRAAPPPGPGPVTRTNLTTGTDEGLPTATWVTGGAGAVALISAITLAALASSASSDAFGATDPVTGEERFGSAKALHTGSIAAFATSGVLFGAAAVTLAFD
ncbi:MAG: hypothetical protein RIT81_15095 [Deltaproteobacteria bacterium]